MLLCAAVAQAQYTSGSYFSPYTFYGLGEMNTPGTAINKSMGGIGVAERTVIRDIGALSLSKPICVDTGRRGGVYLIERKSLSRPTLTARETAALKHTVAFLVAHTGEFSPGVGDPAPPTPAELQILCEIIAYCGKS